MSPQRTHGWLKGIYLCFSGRESGIELLFTRARSSRVGNASPEKLNPDQTSFKMISPTVTGALATASGPIFQVRKLPEVEGNVHHFHRQARKFLQNLAPPQPKTPASACLRHPRLAQVKTDGIPGTSCRLQPDFTLSEFYFLFPSQELLIILTNHLSVPGECGWGCGFRWGVRWSSLNAIFGATWFRGLGGLGGSTIKNLISSLRQTATGLKKRKKDRNVLLQFWGGGGGVQSNVRV